jgi:hypothetical protein
MGGRLSAEPKDGNPKYGYLNPKQYQMTEIQNSKRQAHARGRTVLNI